MGTMRENGQLLKIGALAAGCYGDCDDDWLYAGFSFWLLETFPVFSTLGQIAEDQIMFLSILHEKLLSRRQATATMALFLCQFASGLRVMAAETATSRFEFLSKNGNSNCSKQFLDSISTMPAGMRLQGSCCSEMQQTRYIKQIGQLMKYKAIADIPPDPYDLDAKLAAKLLSYYDLELKPEEQKAYDYAMANSEETGPCCCRCWRWKVYGGLAKLLIREHGFDGNQVTEVWNMSNGCGGA